MASTTAFKSFRPIASFCSSGAATARSRGNLPVRRAWRSTRTTSIWVADACNHRIQVFDTEGQLRATVGQRRAAARANLSYPYGSGARRPRPRVRLRVRQPSRAEIHARRPARWAAGDTTAARRASCTIPGPWSATAADRFMSSTRTTIACNACRCKSHAASCMSAASMPVWARNGPDALSHASKSPSTVPGISLLLAILPLVWWFSFRSLSGLGQVRRSVGHRAAQR